MVQIDEPTYRRVEQFAALIYPLVVLVAVTLVLDSSPEPPAAGGGMFVLFAAWFGVVPAALVTGLLVLLANGLYAAAGGSPDRLNVVIAAVMVVSIPPLMYPVVYGEHLLPEVLVVFILPVVFVVGPLAILVHAFRLPTRLSAAVLGTGTDRSQKMDS